MKKVGEFVKDYVMNPLSWKCDLPAFLKEVHDGSKTSPYSVTFNILFKILGVLSQRAIELNDPALNIIMLNLSLYEGSHSKEADEVIEKMRELIG